MLGSICPINEFSLYNHRILRSNVASNRKDMPEDREEGRKLGSRLENTAKGILLKIYFSSPGS